MEHSIQGPELLQIHLLDPMRCIYFSQFIFNRFDCLLYQKIFARRDLFQLVYNAIIVRLN